MASPGIFGSQDPATALEKAVELNRIKTAEACQPTVRIDHVALENSGSSSEDIDPKDGADLPTHQIYCGKNPITLAECKGELASSLPESKKWTALFIVWLVQISMNFNTSLYSNAIPGISEELNVGETEVRWGAAIFLMAYAFGCELWAPWSEELGRYWVLEASLGLINILQFGVVFARNIGTVLTFRMLGGLCTAGGSITLGMIADMWDKEHHQTPLAFVVFASVGGSVLGPVVGGFIEEHSSWKWAIWVQLIFGALVHLLHFFFVPETRATILMDRVAKRKRVEAANEGKYLNRWGPNEVTPFRERFSWREIFVTWIRPFKMFLTEPIVLCLSLLSGFSDALIFMFIQSFGLVYKKWRFTRITIGLSFLPFLIGYGIAWISWVPVIRRNKAERARQPTSEYAQFESRLWWLLYLAPCLPIGLIGFAWTSGGPPVHWIGSMIFTCLCGIANYGIYMATIDYMVTAYGPYSASATGGNGWARDFLAGVLTPVALPFYHIPFGDHHIEYSGTILAAISTILVACVFVVYKYGPQLRRRSSFAQKLKAAEQEPEQPDHIGITGAPDEGTASSGTKTGGGSPLQITASRSEQILHSRVGFSRQASPNASCHQSRANSPIRGTRPAKVPRARSLYHDERTAAKIKVDPSLLYPPEPRFKSFHDHNTADAISASRDEQHGAGNSRRATQQVFESSPGLITDPSIIHPAIRSVPPDTTINRLSSAIGQDIQPQSGATSVIFDGATVAAVMDPSILGSKELLVTLPTARPRDLDGDAPQMDEK